MYVLDDPVDYNLDASRSLGATARRAGVDPREYAYDIQLQRDGNQLIYTPLFNFVHGNLDDVRAMITDPVALFGLSDAGAHCGQICDGSMTTTYLSLWGRDRREEDGIPVEQVVHQITQRPAAHFGWLDRGVVEPGRLADLNVIDLDGPGVPTPRDRHRPAGRRAPPPAGGHRLPLDGQAGPGDLRGRPAHRGATGRPGPGDRLTAGRGPRLTPPDVLVAIVEGARRHPDHPAVKDPDRALDYAGLCAGAARMANGMAGAGVTEGDRVALLLPNSVDFVVAALASLWVGAIFVPLAVTDPEARVASIVEDCARPPW